MATSIKTAATAVAVAKQLDQSNNNNNGDGVDHLATRFDGVQLNNNAATRDTATTTTTTTTTSNSVADSMKQCYENLIVIDAGANLTNKKYSRDLDSVVQRAKDSGECVCVCDDVIQSVRR